MSTTAELVSFVRDITDLDEVDLPTSLVISYMRDGFDRIVNLERRWPFYETTYILDTVGLQRDYALNGIDSGDLREVTSIVDESSLGNRLRFISVDDAEAIWNGNFDSPSRPLYYGEWGETIKLYPKPDAAYRLTVRGYRKPSYTWTTNTTLQVDVDERLHTAIAYYAVSQAYKRQEDVEMTSAYKQSFDEAVSLARKDLMRSPSGRPMVFSGGTPRPSGRYWLQSLGRTLGP